MKYIVCCLLVLFFVSDVVHANDALESGWNNPPRQARLRNYWWWLNGCVTKEAITRDLEQMAAKGFGGALICDADGSNQNGNARVSHGLTFMTPPWREMFKHSLKEAERLNLEMSVNIQSGWNLGGPQVTADDAGKKFVWTESVVQGPASIRKALVAPERRNDYYRDSVVVAFPIDRLSEPSSIELTIQTSCQQNDKSVLSKISDGDSDTFWISDGRAPGAGPTLERPEWIQASFEQPVHVDRIIVTPRIGYGPKKCELLVSSDGTDFSLVKEFAVKNDDPTSVSFDSVKGSIFRLAIYGAFDRRFPNSPRSVQIAELQLAGADGVLLGKRNNHQKIKNWKLKAGIKSLHISAPDSSSLLVQDDEEFGEDVAKSSDVVDLTDSLDAQGILTWDVPEGTWQVLRMGYTVSDRARVRTSSEGWAGFAIDVLDEGAFNRYWDAVVAKMIDDARPFVGKTLKYLHTDSWEIEPLNWTPTLLEEFEKRRGYDPIPWLPTLTGRVVNDRGSSNKFLNDFRKTIGDLVIDNHYRPFRELARQNGLSIHPESGGPHAVPIDAQRCLGFSDVPMSEFWAESWQHRVGDAERFFVKQPASAAHTYGRRLVAAEGFTTIGPHWQETLWDNLKPAFDKACCEGMNLLFWHEFVCSPAEQGMPGIQYFAGTHLNPNVTWWERSKPVFDYINRCQFMLQQGMFVADVCYYYGDHVPNFAQLKSADPTGVLPGYDYDVITEEALLTLASVENGRIVLPDGMSYQVLVLRDNDAISEPLLKRVSELVEAGATVIGSKPSKSISLSHTDAEVERIATAVWSQERVHDGKKARERLLASGIKPDFEFNSNHPDTSLDYIHRRDGDTDIYFISNRSTHEEDLNVTFRVSRKTPEFWDAVSGDRKSVINYTELAGRTTLPVQLAPFGSIFVVFRNPSDKSRLNSPHVDQQWKVIKPLNGPWDVTFDQDWGGPGTVQFKDLVSWTDHDDLGIKYYSGTAVYQNKFMISEDLTNSKSGTRLWLDLGSVRELAEIKVNGHSCGIVWAPPFRVEITDHVRPNENQVEIDVVNFWPNRIIGDDALPPNQRFTRTNIRKLTQHTELMKSGLLGPVTLKTNEHITRQ